MTAKNWTCSKRSKEVRSAALQTVLRLGDVLIALPLRAMDQSHQWRHRRGPVLIGRGAFAECVARASLRAWPRKDGHL
jgi:hypothetical protein